MLLCFHPSLCFGLALTTNRLELFQSLVLFGCTPLRFGFQEQSHFFRGGLTRFRLLFLQSFRLGSQPNLFFRQEPRLLLRLLKLNLGRRNTPALFPFQFA